MLRRRVILCVGMALLFGGATAGADEAPAPVIDPVEVATLLLSPDEAVREHGVALLLERIEQGGELLPFLRAMAAAQARAPIAAPPAGPGDGSRLAEEASAAIARLFREAEAARRQLLAEAGTPAPPSAPAPVAAPAPAPGPGPAAAARPDAARPEDREGEEAWGGADASSLDASTPTAASGPPVLRATLSVIRVPRAEYDAWLRAVAGRGALSATPTPTSLGGEDALRRLEVAQSLPGAATLLERREGLGPDGVEVLEAASVGYRQSVRRTKGGAWALHPGLLPRGLAIRASATPTDSGSARIRIDVRYTDVPQPLPVTRVRPSADVEPIEVDNPEWRTAFATLAHDVPPGGAAAFIVPDVEPDTVVLVGIRATE